MKLFIKLMIFILVLGLAGPFIMKRPDGRPWMSLEDLLPDWHSLSPQVKNLWSSIGDSAAAVTSGEPGDKTRVYKWRDSEGHWQFSDSPNPSGASEAVLIDPNTNIIQATPLPKRKDEKAQTVTAQESQIGVPLPTTVAPGKVSALMRDAQQVQELVNQRTQALEAISSGQRADQ